MLSTLRGMGDKPWTTIGKDFRADVKWFEQYSASANGVSLFDPKIEYAVVIECDACLTGAGGNSSDCYYTWTYSSDHAKKSPAIHQLEALNILVAIRTLTPRTPLKGKGILVYIDNQSSGMAITTGKTKDPVLAACAREIWLEAAVKDMDITIIHKPGSLIPLADALSRMSVDYSKRQFAAQEIHNRRLLQLPPVLNGYCFFDDKL